MGAAAVLLTLGAAHALQLPARAANAPARLVRSAATRRALCTAVAPAAERLRFPTLQSSDFQHPDDLAATAGLRRFWPIELALRNVLFPVVEEASFLDNIASGVQVTSDQMPTLHAKLIEACAILGIRTPPDLYVRQSPYPNAYTLAVDGRRPFIVVHTSLLDLLNPAETQAVLAHECGHLVCEHGLWITVANVLAVGADVIDRRLGAALDAALLSWRRSAELTCDRAALLVAQDPAVVVSVILKLAGGSAAFGAELSTEAFLRQVQRFDESAKSRLGGAISRSQAQSLTHPLPILRASELNKWANGAQYRRLLASAERRRAALGDSD